MPYYLRNIRASRWKRSSSCLPECLPSEERKITVKQLYIDNQSAYNCDVLTRLCEQLFPAKTPARQASHAHSYEINNYKIFYFYLRYSYYLAVKLLTMHVIRNMCGATNTHVAHTLQIPCISPTLNDTSSRCVILYEL